MHGPLHEFLSIDHARLDALLDSCVAGEAIDDATYEAFRGGLLRHIGMEEKILLPAARRMNGRQPIGIAGQLRADHAALAALLVPTPTSAIVDRIRKVLSLHNALEEDPDGMYDACDRLCTGQVEELLDRLRSAPEVPLAPHFNGQRAFDGIERLLRAAARLQ